MNKKEKQYLKELEINNRDALLREAKRWAIEDARNEKLTILDNPYRDHGFFNRYRRAWAREFLKERRRLRKESKTKPEE